MICQTSQIAVAFFPRGDSNVYLIFKRKVQRFSNTRTGRECPTVIFRHHSWERIPRKRYTYTGMSVGEVSWCYICRLCLDAKIFWILLL